MWPMYHAAMTPTTGDWEVIESLLPDGWRDQAWTTQAFRRVRYTQEPGQLLRLLLFYAVSGTGQRETLKQAKVAGLATMSQVALFKRLKTSAPWLEWIATALCGLLRNASPAINRRVRAIDS